MLQLRATRPWRSTRFASQLSHVNTAGTAPSTTETAHKPSSILSRLSNRTRSRIRHNSDTEQKSPSAHIEVTHKKQRPRATSFISTRSAQQRDHAAEKWFTDVRKLDIDNVRQSDNLESLPRKKHMGSEFPKHHEMRPRTDLNALFAPPTARSAASLRLQTKKELGGDYTSYLPNGYADLHRFPIDYARLVLGKNKHIPLSAQAGALNIIEEAIQGGATRQAV